MKIEYLYLTDKGLIRHTSVEYKIPQRYRSHYVKEVLHVSTQRENPKFVPYQAILMPENLVLLEQNINITRGDLMAAHEYLVKVLLELRNSGGKSGQQTLRKSAGLKSFMDKNSVKTSNIVSGLNKVIGK